MINKVLSSIAIVGVLCIIGYEYMQATYLQERFSSFVAKGPRYTAQDGEIDRQERKQADQELCEILREVARHSIGFQQSGKPLPDCNYVNGK